MAAPHGSEAVIDVDPAAFGLSLVTDLTPDGEPVLDSDDGEELAQSFPEVSCVLGHDHDLGPGKLSITTRRVIWLSSVRSHQVLAASFHSINIHAISQDPQAYQKPCIYMQMEEPASDDDGDDGAAEVRHARRTMQPNGRGMTRRPGAEGQLCSAVERIFKVLCDCAALNPDPGMEGDEEDADFFYDEDAAAAGAGVDAAAARRLDGLLTMPHADELDQLLADNPERFDDPEEVEDDEPAPAAGADRPHANGSAPAPHA